jgi:hypothetical protein
MVMAIHCSPLQVKRVVVYRKWQIEMANSKKTVDNGEKKSPGSRLEPLVDAIGWVLSSSWLPRGAMTAAVVMVVANVVYSACVIAVVA